MALNFIVVLEKAPTPNTYASDYFPRGFHYMKEATQLVGEVEMGGGKATLVPRSQFTMELLSRLKVKGEGK